MFHREALSLPETKLLLSFIEQDVLPSEHFTRAQKVFTEVSKEIPEVLTLGYTPQGPRHHAEGPRVEAHITRMLACLFYLNSTNFSLELIEDFAREKSFTAEVRSLQKTLKEQEAFLTAYAFCHDLGKPLCLTFKVLAGKKGESVRIIDAEQFDKLYRAFAAHRGEESAEKTVAAFYDEYGIVTHYIGHDRAGASPEFSKAREAVLKHFGVSLSSAKLMTELIRHHMDVLTAFTRGVDTVEYTAFTALAGRLGLNKEMFLDMAVAGMFLDAVAGSLHYEEGTFSHAVTPLLNWYRAEREVAPERHEEREHAEKRAGKLVLKKAYDAAGLSPEKVFELLNTPIGPIRGEVMKKIDELVQNPEADIDFGEHTAELRRRAAYIKL
jgi:hypothetical protein